jgi:hypothetical protein
VPEQDGYPIEPEFVRLDIYRLMTCFGGSRFITESAQSENKWESEFFRSLANDLERSEISRLLVSIAVTSRNHMDQGGWHAADLPGLPPDEVGVLCSDARQLGASAPLTFREACNKVIHATNIRFEVNQDADYKTWYLLPIIHLYGDKNGTGWKATVDVPKFLFWASRNS